MKNKFLVIFFFIIFFSNGYTENLLIEAKNISIDKKSNISIFENEVVVTTEDNNVIKSDYVEYDKNLGFLKLKNNIIAEDSKGNIIKTNYAEYYKDDQILKSIGPTIITTPENYIIESEDILFNNKKRFINSKNDSIIKDSDGNNIFLENFDYQIDNNIFKSIGFIKIEDKKENIYEFSQIYIDTKRKEILGTDNKSFLNQDSFKFDEKNKPRIFSNTVKLENNKRSFGKSTFTLCDYRKNDKCPPWSIQSSKMLHDSNKKTIYYENAVVKVYDIPIFYFPRLSHPDPTVDRRSGFLSPSLYDTQNLGEGIAIPYFFDLGEDKNFTFTNRLYYSENPLFMGAYHQAFKNASLMADFGYTDGYKKTSFTKKAGDKSHFFSKYTKNFKNENNSENNLALSLQTISNDKYLKLYRIESDLVDYNTDTLKNSFNFSHEDDNLFLGFNTSIYETLRDDYTDKYEYILPEITLDKNLLNNQNIGTLDMQSNLKIHNYDTNKLTNFLVNDFNWTSKNKTFDNGLNTKLLGNVKNINYEAKNEDIYKNELTNEVHGALGLLSELNLQKEQKNSKHLLKPKILFRFAPGSMRKESTGSRLNPITAFSVNKLENINNFETGLSGTIGFDYEIKSDKRNFDFSLAQVVSEKENKKMASVTSLDEKLSDLVGSTSLKLNEKLNLNYNFALDQNYNDLNYNDIGAKINFGPSSVDFNYLQEKKHIGDQEYLTTKLNLTNKDNGLFSVEAKRNLITSSSEFYNLSYEYFNDCLRAGLVYRREFYNDSELEPENSLLFKITLTPFGDVAAPSFSQ